MFKKFKKAALLLPVPFLLTGCFNIPVTCDTNQRTTYAPIEIRNQQPGYVEPYVEYYPCNQQVTCQRYVSRWVDGSLEWRDKGKYDNPDEGWRTWYGDPKKSEDSETPYRVTEESDKVICDNRDNFKHRNGEHVRHNVKTTIYTPKN